MHWFAASPQLGKQPLPFRAISRVLACPMPTYEYACPKCGLVEAFQSIKEDALTKCPVCKKQKVTRMVSLGGGVIFKGSGFWETDYNRSKEYADKAKGEHSAPATTTADPGTADATSDAKPAAPADDKAANKATSTSSSKPAAEEKSPPSKPQAQPQAKKIDAPAAPANPPKSPKSPKA
jgi:putative FmdB family regulatory protein